MFLTTRIRKLCGSPAEIRADAAHPRLRFEKCAEAAYGRALAVLGLVALRLSNHSTLAAPVATALGACSEHESLRRPGGSPHVLVFLSQFGQCKRGWFRINPESAGG